MAAGLSRNELLVHLQSAEILFRAMRLERSADYAKEMRSAIMNNVDTSELITIFEKLQIATKEFASSEYKQKCFSYVSSISSRGMLNNPMGMRTVLNHHTFGEVQRERIEAFTVLTRISRILEKGAGDPYEKILGIAFSYAYLVEGVFKKAIQDCYIVDETGYMRPVNIDEVQHFGVGKILNEYRQKGKDLIIFEGWDGVVRNAVSHARMHFDTKTEVMTFIDHTPKGKKVSSYSFELLQDKYSKLFDVFSLVLIRNQIWRINDIIFAVHQG